MNLRKALPIVAALVMVFTSCFAPLNAVMAESPDQTHEFSVSGINLADTADQYRKFLIIVSNPLYQTGNVASELMTYRIDLLGEGWASTLIRVNNVPDSTANAICQNETDLKTLIASYYNNGYEGFVLVGSDPQIPTAYWHDPSENNDAPTDLFYADMDTWTDGNSDGVYDCYTSNGHFVSGSLSPEMFWGRISAGCISDSIQEEASKVCSYFDKIHNYRVNGGNLSEEQKKKTLMFFDCPDFKNLRCQDDFKELGTEMHVVLDDTLTTPDRLVRELESGYAFATTVIHGFPDSVSFKIWDRDFANYGGNYGIDIINSISPMVNYLNFCTCSGCRYQDKSLGKVANMGAAYLFNNSYMINVTGFTAPWGYCPDKTYWDGIASGQPIGECLKGYSYISPEEALLGDPTMYYRVAPVTNKVPHITTNLAGSSSPEKRRLEIAPNSFFVIQTSDPESDPVTIQVDGLPQGATAYGIGNSFTWCPAASDSGHVYNLTATACNTDSNGIMLNKYVENFTVKVLSDGSFMNTGFEDMFDGFFTNWDMSAFDPTISSFSMDTSVKHSGQASARITSTTADNDYRLGQEVTVTPNTNYRLSGYVRTDNVQLGKGAFLGVQMASTGMPNTSQRLTGTNDWTYLSVDFNSGSSSSVEIECRIGLPGPTINTSSGTAWFDDLSLEELP